MNHLIALSGLFDDFFKNVAPGFMSVPARRFLAVTVPDQCEGNAVGLHRDIDNERSKAKVDNGVLTLPKKVAVAGQRLTVE